MAIYLALNTVASVEDLNTEREERRLEIPFQICENQAFIGIVLTKQFIIICKSDVIL